MMNPDIIKKRIKKFELLEEMVERELKGTEITLNEKAVQFEKWGHVKETTRIVREFMETNSDMSLRLDIGNRIMSHSEITDLERTYINIGLSYMLEMDFDEANRYLEIKLELLRKEIAHFRQIAQVAKFKFSLILSAKNELQSLLLPLPKEK